MNIGLVLYFAGVLNFILSVSVYFRIIFNRCFLKGRYYEIIYKTKAGRYSTMNVRNEPELKWLIYNTNDYRKLKSSLWFPMRKYQDGSVLCSKNSKFTMRIIDDKFYFEKEKIINKND